MIDKHEIDYEEILEYAKEMPDFFSYNSNINKNSYMNWQTHTGGGKHNLIMLADAYLDGAYRLLAACIADNFHKEADALIFPILFNTIHGIELYLKGLLVSFNILTDKDDIDFSDTHNLKAIANSTATLIEEFKKNESNSDTAKEFIDCINVVKNFIQLLYNKTDDMTFARYPVTAKKKNVRETQFYIDEKGNVVIDMEILIEEIALVYRCLGYIFERCEDYIQFLYEMKREYGEY